MTLETDAKEVRDLLKAANDLFPNRFCKPSVIAMHTRGYEIVQGTVNLDNYCGIGREHRQDHYWNYDPATKRHFDITASQFNIHIKGEKLPKIAVWKDGETTVFVKKRRSVKPHEII